MRYLILSDLHANLHALDAVLADATLVGFDQVLVLGDLVGYGADPAKVMARTFAMNPVAMIRGNHDRVCAALQRPQWFSDDARQAMEWTIATLTPGQLKMLGALPIGPRSLDNGVVICHGAVSDEDAYVLHPRDAARAARAMTERICLFGHTHIPTLFVVADGDVESLLPEEDVHLPPRGQLLINVGSVGQPRDGDSRAAYGVLDTASQILQFRRVTYDVGGAQARIRAEGLPVSLAERLEFGR